MRPAFGQFNVPTDEYLQYAAQFGATDVLLKAAAGGRDRPRHP